MTHTYTHSFIWPSGTGETPCSETYLTMLEQRDELWNRAQELGGTDFLEPKDYDAFYRLENDLGVLSTDPAHRGPPIRW